MAKSNSKPEILIVDDEVIIASDIQSRLENLGYVVCGNAETGEKSIELVEELQPSLVMMDIVLQGEMDGIDAAEVIRDKWGIPVVFLTAYADTDRLERAKLTYPFGYLLKPFQDRELKITLEMALYVAEVDNKRKELEDSLRESEQKYKMLYTHAPAGIFEIDFTNNKFTEINTIICEYTGYTKDELLNMNPIDILTGKSQVHFIDRLAKINKGESVPTNPEFCIKNKNGSTRWVQLNVDFKRQNNSITGASVVALDITDRKQAEEALQAGEARAKSIFNAINDAVFLHPMLEIGFGKFIDVNEIACKRYGYSYEEFLSMTAADMTRQDEVNVYEKKDWRTKFYEKGQITFESVHIKKNGGLIPVEINSYLFDMDDNKVIVSVARDISDRKLKEDMIAESLKEKEALLNELNHRVKNNMQVILSLMRLQSDRIDDEQLRAAFIETQNRIYAMSAVHETLHKSDNLSTIDLAEYLIKLSNMVFQTYGTVTGNTKFYTNIQSSHVNLKKSYPIGLVINELISNALKYAFTEMGEGEISISGKNEGNTVKLVVSDTGAGIPTDFDWRNSESLGLQIVRSLVEDQLQGTIDLDRTLGTKWTITFPV